MITPPSILSPPGEPLLEKRKMLFGTENEAQLEKVLSEMMELIQPLASTDTRRRLNLELDRRAQEYLHLKTVLWRLIVSKLPEEELMPSVYETYDEISNLIREDTKVLSPECRELLLDLIDSLRELLEAVVDGLRIEHTDIIDILLECNASLQRADMCLSSVLLVLMGDTTRWNVGSIKLLCHTASEHMLNVEDIFLMHSNELSQRLKTRGETMSIAEVKRELGLSS